MNFLDNFKKLLADFETTIMAEVKVEIEKKMAETQSKKTEDYLLPYMNMQNVKGELKDMDNKDMSIEHSKQSDNASNLEGLSKSQVVRSDYHIHRFDVHGSKDTFYPVRFNLPSMYKFGMSSLHLARASTHINGSWHGTFELDLDISNTHWGHRSNIHKVKRHYSTRRRFTLGIFQPSTDGWFILYLRGGTTYYGKMNNSEDISMSTSRNGKSWVNYELKENEKFKFNRFGSEVMEEALVLDDRVGTYYNKNKAKSRYVFNPIKDSELENNMITASFLEKII